MSSQFIMRPFAVPPDSMEAEDREYGAERCRMWLMKWRFIIHILGLSSAGHQVRAQPCFLGGPLQSLISIAPVN